MKHHRSRTKKRPAFSLMELTVVLVLMGIVAAIATPRYLRSVHRYRAGCAARRLAADLAYVQAQAKSTSVSKQLVFNASTKTYSIENARDLDGRSGTYTVDLREDPYSVDSLVLTLTGGTNQITFDMYGSPSATGTIKIVEGDTYAEVTVGLPDTPAGQPPPPANNGNSGGGGLITIRIGGLVISL